MDISALNSAADEADIALPLPNRSLYRNAARGGASGSGLQEGKVSLTVSQTSVRSPTPVSVKESANTSHKISESADELDAQNFSNREASHDLHDDSPLSVRQGLNGSQEMGDRKRSLSVINATVAEEGGGTTALPMPSLHDTSGISVEFGSMSSSTVHHQGLATIRPTEMSASMGELGAAHAAAAAAALMTSGAAYPSAAAAAATSPATNGSFRRRSQNITPPSLLAMPVQPQQPGNRRSMHRVESGSPMTLQRRQNSVSFDPDALPAVRHRAAQPVESPLVGFPRASALNTSGTFEDSMQSLNGSMASVAMGTIRPGTLSMSEFPDRFPPVEVHSASPVAAPAQGSHMGMQVPMSHQSRPFNASPNPNGSSFVGLPQFNQFEDSFAGHSQSSFVMHTIRPAEMSASNTAYQALAERVIAQNDDGTVTVLETAQPTAMAAGDMLPQPQLVEVGHQGSHEKTPPPSELRTQQFSDDAPLAKPVIGPIGDDHGRIESPGFLRLLDAERQKRESSGCEDSQLSPMLVSQNSAMSHSPPPEGETTRPVSLENTQSLSSQGRDDLQAVFSVGSANLEPPTGQRTPPMM